MKAVQRPCEVTHLTAKGIPQVIVCDGHTYRLSQELDAFRAGGRWWLGEPSRDVWVLVCGSVTLEVARWDTAWQGSQWWILRVQD